MFAACLPGGSAGPRCALSGSFDDDDDDEEEAAGFFFDLRMRLRGGRALKSSLDVDVSMESRTASDRHRYHTANTSSQETP